MITVVQFLILPVLALTTPARPTTPPKSAAVADSSRMNLVEVQNDQRVPVTVYAQNAVGEVTLGVVTAGEIQNLRVPVWLVAFDPTIQFFVQPGHGLEQASGNVDLSRANHVGLVVPTR